LSISSLRITLFGTAEIGKSNTVVRSLKEDPMVIRSKPNTAQLKRALAYFDRKGIDPRIEPAAEAYPSVVPQAPPFTRATEGITTEACTIDLIAVLFYAHVTVVTASGHTFDGHSGGIGIGDISGAGVIYYADLSTLLSTHAFGVAFGAEDGGVMQVTWGSHGNATIVGIGEGLGAFGGSGDWT
jgi:hypothetical protein